MIVEILENVFLVARITISLILRVFYYLLFARAILSWLPGVQGKIPDIIYGITEMALAPIRRITDKFSANSFLPIDWSFIVLVVIITVLLRII